MATRCGSSCFWTALVWVAGAILLGPVSAMATPNSSPQAGEYTASSSSSSALGVTVNGIRSLSRDRSEDGTLVTGERLRRAERSSLLSALASESAGLYVNSAGALHGVANGASGGMSLRGLGGSPNTQVLVVEDGVADYQGIFGHPLPDAYVPALVDQVLIEKGGDSVLYGSNAIGGAIVIRSRFREQDGVEVTNDSAYGSYRTLRETVTLLGRRDRWDGSAAVHAMSTEGHRSGTAGQLLVGSGALRHRFSSGLSLTLRDKAIHLNGADPGPASHPYPNHFYEVWRNATSLGLDWVEGDLRLRIVPAVNAGVHRLYDGFRSTDLVAGTSAEVEYRPGRMVELLVGLDQHHIGGTVENRATGEVTPVSSMNDAACYAQATIRPFAPMSLVLGARELYSDRYGAMALYKAGFRTRIFRGLVAHTRVARNFRQPTLRELYLPFPTANPGLRPEYALNWDGGLTYLMDHLEASATLYRTDARDMIRYFGVWPSAEVVNIDHAVFWGLESNLRLKRLGPLTAFASFDHKNVGRYTRQNPSTKANFGMELALGSHRDHITVGMSAEWVSGLYMANYSREPMDNVFVVDAQLRHHHLDETRQLTLEPYLLLRNLFDQRYAYIADYPMPGFNVMLGLRMMV